MTEPLPIDAAGWIHRGRDSLEPYAWIVRCPEHPPLDDSLWEPLSASECPVEGACEVCGEFLI